MFSLYLILGYHAAECICLLIFQVGFLGCIYCLFLGITRGTAFLFCPITHLECQRRLFLSSVTLFVRNRFLLIGYGLHLLTHALYYRSICLNSPQVFSITDYVFIKSSVLVFPYEVGTGYRASP